MLVLIITDKCLYWMKNSQLSFKTVGLKVTVYLGMEGWGFLKELWPEEGLDLIG